MSKTPILFCHYGNSDYLQYTLSSAKKFNPAKQIILIGDNENLPLSERLGITHIPFNKFENTEMITLFNSVYRHVAGPEHGKEFWTKFVFLRWFYVWEVVKEFGFEQFWHFDSDNLIISDLIVHENKFKNYDLTEQCNGICINGFINNAQVIESYLSNIIELFKDESFLSRQIADFQLYTHYAFTEMRAYAEFKRTHSIKHVRLNTILEDSTFDDCLCESHGYLTQPFLDKTVKKIQIDSQGCIYGSRCDTGNSIRFNSLNMSWLPTEFIHGVFLLTNDATFRNKYLEGKESDIIDHVKMKHKMDIYLHSFIQRFRRFVYRWKI
jgi:hypothetical protein